jgi:hypothetical protein
MLLLCSTLCHGPAVSLLGCLESEQLSAATQVSWSHTSGCAKSTFHGCQYGSSERPVAAVADLYCGHIAGVLAVVSYQGEQQQHKFAVALLVNISQS